MNLKFPESHTFLSLADTEEENNTNYYKDNILDYIETLYMLEVEVGNEPNFLQLGKYDHKTLFELISSYSENFRISSPPEPHKLKLYDGEVSSPEEKTIYLYKKCHFFFGSLWIVYFPDIEFHLDVTSKPLQNTRYGKDYKYQYYQANRLWRRF